MLPIISQLNSKRIVLASSSPRRKELLKIIGLNVESCASTFEENLDPKDFNSFSEFVEETALQKVLEVTNRLDAEAEIDGKSKADIVIGADTMVALNGEMYGKPKNKEDAIETLNKLNGKTNVVFTGVAIKYGDHIEKFTESTEVQFGKLTTEQIQAYVDTGEPLDKAGSYGIQHIGSTLVERINGDFFTVIGLPVYRLSFTLHKLYKELK
ncbi:uncharacterized protein LOC116349500 [Contarinia nasturtii]|uniref:uncharacterized protein LOC116349500 n=1 Tax=Contarinia nasturtii TaxID=265458 RepID=UPI0012D44438|nr:uncharacterized protein LOC116349500 [Contarinia nasturtii]